jgi:hypothetical protein
MFSHIEEAQMARKIAVIAFCVALVSGVCLNSNANRGNAVSTVSAAWAQNCNVRDNMGETAESFVGRCCKGSVKSEFPGEYWQKTLNEIDSDCSVGGRRGCEDGDEPSASSAQKARKAWKLLTRSEYRK